MISVSLPENLTIESVAAIKGALLSALESDSDVQLDAAAVCYADLAGLQVLCAAVRSAMASQKSVRFVEGKRSEAIDTAARDLGFDTSGDGATELRWVR